ncbi:hypothetical protein XENOCAPTIV_006086, partial [Xenoophorus captivus]
YLHPYGRATSWLGAVKRRRSSADQGRWDFRAAVNAAVVVKSGRVGTKTSNQVAAVPRTHHGFIQCGHILTTVRIRTEPETQRGNMPATEKDLAEDAPWKKIQQNTFTRWINEHLKCVNKRIGDLQLDLGDGLRLIALLEVLSQKNMYRKYHSRPNFRQMKLENVSVALEFLERENIKLVSIGK